MERISIPILHTDASEWYDGPALAESSALRRPRQAARRNLRGTRLKGLRVLPFVDDFLFLTSSHSEAPTVRNAVDSVGSGPQPQERDVGARSGDCASGYGDRPRTWCLPRPSREAEGHTRPSTSDLGHRRTKPALDTSKDARSLAGKAQFLYLAIPAARFYLRELHVLSTKECWGARVKLTNQLRRDLLWWRDVPEQK